VLTFKIPRCYNYFECNFQLAHDVYVENFMWVGTAVECNMEYMRYIFERYSYHVNLII